MTKRRILLTIALGAAALGSAVLLVWVLPAWLTRYPQVKGIDKHTAVSATRTGLVGLVVACGAVGSLVYTIRTYRLTNRGQIADRYTKAIEQLDNTSESIRIGGIFALEQVVRERAQYRQTVLCVLNAYIRDRCPLPGMAKSGKRKSDNSEPKAEPASDVNLALQTMKRLQKASKGPALDFGRANLAGADFSGMSLAHADLHAADLRKAKLNDTDLRDADLTDALLADAQFYKAHMDNAQLYQDQLQPGQLDDVKSMPQLLQRSA